MKRLLNTIAAQCGIKEREAMLYLALSTAGWLFFLHQYLFFSGLGVAIPRYAGY